jgi:hypothetical protein
MQDNTVVTDLGTQIVRALVVENASFLIMKTADSVPKHQFIRELTHNAIQSGATHVSWEEDIWWRKHNPDHAAKLCIVDNGHGMTREDLERHIGGFASSGRTQDVNANFGVGAKFAAARFSPAGVVYRTWVSGVGHTCTLVMDVARGSMGLTATHEIALSAAPVEIQRTGHGTVVTLLGDGPSHDTTMNPNLGGGGAWVGQQLARRYFRLPSNVRISSLERIAANTRSNEVLAQRAHLDARAEASGVVRLARGVMVHWWLLSDRGGKRGVREQINPSSAQFGVLLGNDLADEVYDLKVGGNARHHMQRFGIRVGADRVALYVQPGEQLRPAPNLQRTRVELPGGEDLPLEDIGDEFIAQMLRVLSEYVRAQSAAATFDPGAIAERLAAQLELMGVGRYRRSANGTAFVSPDDVAGMGGGLSGNPDMAEGSAPGGTPGKPAGGTGDATSSSTAGDRARPLPIRVPQTILCSDQKVADVVPLAEAGTRIADRAAVYVGGASPILYVNLDFRAYQKLEESVARDLLSASEAKERPDLVRQWVLPVYIEGLLEVVITGQLLSESWSPEDKSTLTSPEALTLAALQRGYAHSIAKMRKPR